MQRTSILKDPLTDALSRATLQERFREEIERARRHTLPLSLIMMDLDHFKSINDALGHLRGDESLVECVQRIHHVIRASDLLFRYGGDEFLLLLPHTDKDQALAVAERLRAGIEHSAFGSAPPIRVTASIGIATFPLDGETPEKLFAVADARHYAAKRGGRNRVIAADRMQPDDRFLAEPSRLIDRDEALESLRYFLDTIPAHPNGLLTVSGSRGSGRTRFLTEIGRAARLRGFLVLNLQGSPALRTRVFGALTEATRDWGGLASPAEGPEPFIQSLGRLLAAKEAAGLAVVVDGLADLDPFTINMLRSLFASGAVRPLALAYAADPDSDRSPLSLDASFQQAIHLDPLTTSGVAVWLRAALRWEPPREFAEWLCQETGGLPALLERGLHELAEQQVLQRGTDGWRLAPEYAHTRLRRRLDDLAGATPDNLPIPTTSFVGREHELQLVKDLLSEKRLITVMGPGGSGKSRLAVQAAAEVMRQFRHGVFFVPLAPVESPDLIIPAIATAVGLQLNGPGSPKLHLLQYMKDRELLLILDNMEHLIQGVDLIAEILQSAPRVSVLATSRERLHLPGESILELGGLSMPQEGRLQSCNLSGCALLFVERAKLLDEWFVLTPEDAPHVARICRLVHGMPLGIELAAAWIRMLSCQEIADGIAQSPDLLQAEGSGVADRHRNLRSVFNHSWNLLSGPEQLAFAQLSVFRGGFTREAASAVAGTSLLLLSALLDKSLLRRAGSGRYEVHELLRQYCSALLDPSDLAAVEARHAEYYLSLAERLAKVVTGPEQVESFQVLTAEHDNFRAGLAWAIRTGSPDTAMRFGGALWQFWWRRGHLAEGRHWLEAALDVDAKTGGSEQRTHARAMALFAAAKLTIEQEGNATALYQAEESVRLFQLTGDKEGLSNALAELGHAHRKHGNYAGARQCFDQSVAIRRNAGDTNGVCVGLVGLGLLALSTGDYPEARARLEETLALQRNQGNRLGIIQAQCILATIHMVVGEYSQAEALLEESLRLIDRADVYSLSIALALLGESALGQNRLELAKPLLLESLSLKRVASLHGQLADTLLNLGCLARRSGDAVEALTRCREALTCLQTGGDRRNTVNGLALAAATAYMTGQEERAARLLGAVDATSSEIGYALNLAFRQEYSYVTDSLGERMQSARLHAARAAGRALTLEQAVAYALSEKEEHQVGGAEAAFSTEAGTGPRLEAITVPGVTVHTVMAPWDDYTGTYLQLVKMAQRSIHVMTFSATQRDFIDLLVDKQNSGVEVHLIQDYQQYAKQPMLQEQIGRLMKGAPGADVVIGTTPIIPNTPPPRNQTGKPFPCPAGWALHSKVIIVDGEWMADGSGNQSYGAPKECNTISIIRDQARAATFLAQFESVRAWILENQEAMQPTAAPVLTAVAQDPEDAPNPPQFQQGPGVIHENVTVTTYLTPDDRMGTAFVNLLKNAKRSLYLWVFEITHKQAMAQIIDMAKQGISVSVIQDLESYNEFSDLREWVDQLRAAGADVTVRSSPCQNTFMHMKAAVFDETLVWDGSWNPTYSGLWEANTANVFESSTMAAYYIEQFQRLKSAT